MFSTTDATIVVAIISAIAAIVCAIINGYYGQKQRAQKEHQTQLSSSPDRYQKQASRSKIALIIACAILVATVVFLAILLLTSNQQPIVKITYPIDSANVTVSELVKGFAHNIPKGQKVWVLVYAPGINRYYPMENSVTVSSNGE